MTFSKAAARQNKAMYEIALILWQESGYDPARTPRGDASAHWRFLEPYQKFVTTRMRREFPDIPGDRVRHQVARAKSKIYSDYVRKRNAL